MKTKKKSDAELLELGKKLSDFYESGYISKKQALKFSFLKGLASGVGAFLGGTVVVGLLLWVFSLFDEIPLLGGVLRAVKNTLEN